MKIINFETIEKLSEEINNLPDQHVEALVEQFSQEQPFLLAYLMGVYDEDFSQEERELLFFLGIKIWYIVHKTVAQMPEISEEQIDEVEMDNEEMLNYLAEESEEGFADFAESLLSDHPQKDLLEFALLASTEEDEEDDFGLDEDSRGLMFIVLKTIIDCFEKNIL